MSDPILKTRFRGYLPVVVDVETAGLEPSTHALLQLAIGFVTPDLLGKMRLDSLYSWNIRPASGTQTDKRALAITGIDPFDASRVAFDELHVLTRAFALVQERMKIHQCQKAVLVGHNATFDLEFLLAAANRAGMKGTPFHSFSVMDTATLSMLTCGHNVLAVACEKLQIVFNPGRAHDAAYDTLKTAELFCRIYNGCPPLTSLPLRPKLG